MFLAFVSPALAAPVFDVERGEYDAPFTLTITASEGGTLTVSTDTNAPTAPYSGPLAITTTTVVRAAETTTDGTTSEVTHTYVFVEDVLSSPVMDPAIVDDPTYGPIVASSLRDLPFISLVSPGGPTMTEAAASFEWVDPDGDSGQANAGSYVSGGTSWAYEKTSFRVVFRSRYGPGTLHLDVYGEDATGVSPVDTFDALSLRGGNHDTVFYLGAQGQHLRNYWMDETQLEMGHIAPHGRYAHLYRNGVYHGLYHVRERFNAAMLAEYLGGSEGDYEAINGGSAFDGSGAAWAALVASASDYEAAKEWLNVEDFLDYMVLNFYAGNAWDWAYWHNWAAAGPTSPGRGGFRFHSSDSDICLYYNWDVNILSNGGPSNVYAGLLAEGHPDFLVAVEDAIWRNLTGPLSAEAARSRYARLAASAEDGVVAESARWGYGWWDRDEEWITERDRLLDGWFPYRTDEMFRQFRAAGWLPLDGPTLDLPEGLVPRDTVVTANAPAGASELWVTLDGSDPREAGGAVGATALGPDIDQALVIDRSALVRARARAGETWGPIVEGFYEVDAPPPIVLNEWNAVDEDAWLGGSEPDTGEGSDAALGRVEGNGGDWIELLVLSDVDLRGWSLVMADRNGPAGTLVFAEDPRLADIRAGTLITVAEDLPEDPSYDPDGGDWRFHLAIGGELLTDTSFDVSARDWTLTILDEDGRVAFGPAGEGVSPTDGISSKEVGLLAATPDADTRRDSGKYRSARSSTFGAPNVWEDGAQDLSALRGAHGGVADTDDTGVVDTDPEHAPPGNTPDTSDTCGCITGGSSLGIFGWLPALALLAHRRRA